MKVMITGCNGLLGQKLVKQSPNNTAILGVDLHPGPCVTHPNSSYQTLDISQRKPVLRAVQKFAPQLIINTAAMTNVDACETNKEACWRLNVTAVEHIVYAASLYQSRVVQISTDYVFDGNDGPYAEESIPHPICYYGKSKLASENTIRSAGEDHVIVRTAVLYGQGINIRPNFVTWLISKLSDHQPVSVVDDQIGNTTFANELADGIWRIVETDSRGTFHLTAREIISRYDLARRVAEVFELNQGLIKRANTADLAQSAPRPVYSGLLVDKALADLHVEFSAAREGLQKMRREMRAKI